MEGSRQPPPPPPNAPGMPTAPGISESRARVAREEATTKFLNKLSELTELAIELLMAEMEDAKRGAG